MSLRRLRGWLLRAALKRRVAVALGSLLCAPAIWLWWTDHPCETWYTDGLALVVGSTGLALIVAGIGGRRPDWIEPG